MSEKERCFLYFRCKYYFEQVAISIPEKCNDFEKAKLECGLLQVKYATTRDNKIKRG